MTTAAIREPGMDDHTTELDFRRTVGPFVAGISAMSAQGPSVVHGMTANSSVSLDSLLVLGAAVRTPTESEEP
jgi:hypothetical protein